jgi:DNA sulfur modification protein DndE
MAIKTNQVNRINVTRLSNLLKFKNEAIIARISIAFSLQQNFKFELFDSQKFDNEGKEYKEETLFGYFGDLSNRVIYKALFDQHYGKSLSETEFSKLVKLHLDDGIDKLSRILLDENKGRNYQFDFLLGLVKEGLSLVNDLSYFNQTATFHKELNAYEGLVSFEIGKDLKGESIQIDLNDLKKFDSHHIAIAGMTGSGKTQFIKDILYQITRDTGSELKFIYFDYKGEGKSNELQSFLKATNCEYVDVINGEYDLNPLEYVNLSNENLKLANIKSFVDSIASIATNLGVKQKHILQTVIRDTFSKMKGGEYPTLKKVFLQLKDYYENIGEEPDTLYSIIEDVSSFIFSNEKGSGNNDGILNKNIYLNLPQSLSDTLRQLCVFLTLNYVLEYFNGVSDTKPNDDKIKPLRYILAIDEAHVYLNNKNARKKLENLLRVIRSKGVVVIMLSQGPEDYKTKDFDFVSQVKIPICLNVNNKDAKTIKYFMGTPKSEFALKNALNKLEKGFGLINLNDPEIVKINQFWERSHSN